MPASITDKLRKYKSLFSTTLSTGIGTGTSDTITPASVSGLPTDTAITLTFDRVDSGGVATPSKLERIRGIISGGNFTAYVRGKDGTTEQAHSAGAVIEMIWNADDLNDMVDWGLVEHAQSGVHSSALVTSLKATGAVVTAGTSDTTIVTPKALADAGISASAGTAFWSDVPGTPTRASDTQFTITDTSNANLYDLLFKKGVILRWLESTTFQTAMVISSSYGANTVTVNLVGDSLTAGFSAMKYAIPEALTQTFIIPGTLAALTDAARTWYTESAVYILSADAYVKTAGTTNATVFDINDDGTTKFTTKPSIASTATSDIDNVADTPSTEVAAGSLITVDIDSVSTTAPVEAYIKIFYYPSAWRYRS